MVLYCDFCNDKPWLCLTALKTKIVMAVVIIVFLASGGLVTNSVWTQMHEEAKISELVEQMHAPSTCTVIEAEKYVERKVLPEDASGADPTGCEGEMCKEQFRAWVRVEYTPDETPGSPVLTYAWSHLDDTWEYDKDAVEEFLRQFAHIGLHFPCWYDPLKMEHVRLWDKSSDSFCDRCIEFWIPLGFLCVTFVVVALYIATHIRCAPPESLSIDYSKATELSPEEADDLARRHADNRRKAQEEIERRRVQREANIRAGIIRLDDPCMPKRRRKRDRCSVEFAEDVELGLPATALAMEEQEEAQGSTSEPEADATVPCVPTYVPPVERAASSPGLGVQKDSSLCDPLQDSEGSPGGAEADRRWTPSPSQRSRRRVGGGAQQRLSLSSEAAASFAASMADSRHSSADGRAKPPKPRLASGDELLLLMSPSSPSAPQSFPRHANPVSARSSLSFSSVIYEF